MKGLPVGSIQSGRLRSRTLCPMGVEHAEAGEIRAALLHHIKRGELYPLSDLYDVVRRRVELREGDFLPEAPGASGPRWKRNVRNQLQQMRTEGTLILWDRAMYALAD